MSKPTFERAKAQYTQRFTCEHVPPWAYHKRVDGTYYAPQYASDLEWWCNTIFPGQPDHIGPKDSCNSRNESWPHGTALSRPYSRVQR